MIKISKDDTDLTATIDQNRFKLNVPQTFTLSNGEGA